MIWLFKKTKEKTSDNKTVNSNTDFLHRSLDGTYILKWISYYPEKRMFVPTQLNARGSTLILSGNHFDIFLNGRNTLHETGTFSVEENNGEGSMLFYVNGYELFAKAELKRLNSLTEIRRLTIVDTHYRLTDFGWWFGINYDE